jgi:hypothetical protein
MVVEVSANLPMIASHMLLEMINCGTPSAMK